MYIDFQIGALDKEADWKRLAGLLGGPTKVVNSVIHHLITFWRRSAVVPAYVRR
jgi:hypothetical protein